LVENWEDVGHRGVILAWNEICTSDRNEPGGEEIFGLVSDLRRVCKEFSLRESDCGCKGLVRDLLCHSYIFNRCLVLILQGAGLRCLRAQFNRGCWRCRRTRGFDGWAWWCLSGRTYLPWGRSLGRDWNSIRSDSSLSYELGPLFLQHLNPSIYFGLIILILHFFYCCPGDAGSVGRRFSSEGFPG
jgi:hypothetical protein